MVSQWERSCVPLELEMHSLHRSRRVPGPRAPRPGLAVRARARLARIAARLGRRGHR